MKLNEINVGDIALAFKILKNLGQPWTEFNAYKAGLIDKDGKRLKKSDSTNKDSLTSYDKIIINLKRLLQKAVGKNRIVQRVASTFLLKEEYKDKPLTINTVLKELDLGDYESNSELIEQIQEIKSDELIYAKALVECVKE